MARAISNPRTDPDIEAFSRKIQSGKSSWKKMAFDKLDCVGSESGKVVWLRLEIAVDKVLNLPFLHITIKDLSMLYDRIGKLYLT